MLTSCGKQHTRQMLDESNAVYYWRTDFLLDSTERAFLRQYHVQKVYCRYFDVVMGDDGEPKPNATITFSDTLPDGIELIPTVYITEDCMHQSRPGLAEKIVKRIIQMNETNDIQGVREIQIDCDYTSKSRKTYYNFLEQLFTVYSLSSCVPAVASGKAERTDDNPTTSEGFANKSTVNCKPSTVNRTVSTTIRLHQLSMPAPPVDYGVLMVYNTGDPRNFMERNPILDYRDVYPYLDRLDKYPLPLAAAYPVYQWVRNIHGVRVEHTVEAQEILRVKKAMEVERPDLSRTIITYHLNKDNINRYNPQTYEEIYHH